MRPIRNVEQVGGGNLMEKQSLEAVETLWNEWGMHLLILVSFGLQVFLFVAAGMRRHSISRILRSLIWLAYLSADSVAIFILGHLAVHASGGPRHQLLFFWAPFLLLHLGGQDTITAFSIQDNELWNRHLLGLVTQAAVAGYVISLSSWQDSRLLAATVLMFLCGCFKYVGRTFCPLLASPDLFGRRYSLDFLREYKAMFEHTNFPERRRSSEDILKQRVLVKMLHADVSLPPINDLNIVALLLDTPLNSPATIEGADFLPEILEVLKSSADRCRAYDYIGAWLVRSYECLYTKATLRFMLIHFIRVFQKFLWPRISTSEAIVWRIPIFLIVYSIYALSILFPFLLASTALVLFIVAEKGQLYSRADVIVSYILLIGAIILEVASLFMSILSYVASSEELLALSPLRNVIRCLANYIHPAGSHRKHWSKMLGQYNIIKSYTRQDAAGMMSFVPQWISKYLDDRTLTHIPITEDLEKFVLDKLLDFGTREQDWNFASSRGQLALRGWTVMNKIISGADLPVSVLIWYIATEICYLEKNSSNCSYQTKKRMSRELSNYIMYLVFKCGVMLTSTSELQQVKTCDEMRIFFEKHADLGEGEAIKMMFEANKDGHQPADIDNPPSCGSSQQITQVQLLKNNIKALHSSVLPRACAVASELRGICGDENRWNLIGAVWLEMLFYIAPRCSGAFHRRHLSTGGEFITHVLFLMHHLGPFLPPPLGA